MATNFIEFAALFASSLLLNLAADAQLTILGGPATGSAGGGAAGPLSAALLNLAGLPLNDPCKKYLDNANGTDVQKFNNHEYRVFENCIYYWLANRAQKASDVGLAFGAGVHPIATLPPNLGQKLVNIKVNQITIQHFQLNEFVKDLNIIGYMNLQWNDERLSWDTEQFPISRLRISSANHIWVPLLSTQGHEVAMRNENEAMEMRRVETTREGNVSAMLSFRMATFCDDTDFRHFPDDLYRCCFYLESLVNQELLEFSLDGQPVYTDPKYFRDAGWFMSGTVPTVVRDPASGSQVYFCLNLQRASGAMRVELSISTWVCGIILVFTPLFGTIRLQVFIKLFLFLLQLLTLQLFSNRIGSHLGSAGATPVLMAVLEFSMVINMCSFVFSLVVWLLFWLPNWSLPPYDILHRLTQLVNRYFTPVLRGFDNHRRVEPMAFAPPDCSTIYSGSDDLEAEKRASVELNGNPSANDFCTKKQSVAASLSIKSSQSTAGGSSTESTSAWKTSGRYRGEWIEVFTAIHAIGVVVLSLIFILGCFLIR